LCEESQSPARFATFVSSSVSSWHQPKPKVGRPGRTLYLAAIADVHGLAGGVGHGDPVVDAYLHTGSAARDLLYPGGKRRRPGPITQSACDQVVGDVQGAQIRKRGERGNAEKLVATQVESLQSHESSKRREVQGVHSRTVGQG
jgi:hypothetical protein